MEKLQQILNIKNSNGEVITFFDGKLTLSQLLFIVVAIIAVVAILKFLKGVVRTVLTVVAICVALVNYGIVSPTQIKDAASVISQRGIATYEKLASASDSIKVEGSDVQVKLGDKWFNVSDVTSFVSTGKDTATINVDGESYAVEDSSIISLLKTFK